MVFHHTFNMGLGYSQRGKYITIYSGKISQSVEPNTVGAVTRTNKQGREVHELYHDFIEGKLIAIRTKESKEFGKSWIFVFSDGGEVYNLQLPYSNSYAKAFIKMLPNIDLSEPMKLTPSQKVVEGQTKSSLFINQHDQPIKHAYTRDVPNGLPEMKKIMVKGQEQWDDSEVLIFLENMINADIIPKLEKLNGVVSSATLQNDKATPAIDLDAEFPDEEEKPKNDF